MNEQTRIHYLGTLHAIYATLKTDNPVSADRILESINKQIEILDSYTDKTN